MNLSYEWLSDYLKMSGISAHDLAETMSRTGIEIASVNNFADEVTGLKVGAVISCQPHPDSDHLNVTMVDLGQGEPVQIVCGAPNIQAGIKVIVAPIGATLPGGLVIKETELRGVVSQGMICSLQELGFPDKVVPKRYHDGIYYLPEDAPVGADLAEYMRINDPILELDLTPNRADALSVLGTVFEVAAITNQPVEHLDTLQIQDNEILPSLADLTVTEIDPALAPHFSLRLIENVQVSESPLWLQMRLMKMGIRPLNNIVDVTNYVMLLFGQPLHAYDYDKLPGKAFSVRLAREGETLETLDETQRELHQDDLVIAVDDQVVGLAGVMEGLSTHVTEATQRIVLEAARFNPVNVRKTAKRHDLRSESSMRNEKGLNIATVEQAADYAAQLMAQLSDGQVVQGQLSQSIDLPEMTQIITSQDSIKRHLGMDMSQEEIATTLDRLGFDMEVQGDNLTVTIPYRRWDVRIEADLMEELARIYGYDHLPVNLPSTPTLGGLTAQQSFMRYTRSLIEAQGLNQVQTYVLTDVQKAPALYGDPTPLVSLALPMSEERTSLRQNLFYSLLEVARYNMARQQARIAIYETGRVFMGNDSGKLPKESEYLGILLAGEAQAKTWSQPSRPYDFYDLKGILTTYLKTLQMDQEIILQPVHHLEHFHPGRTAQILYKEQIIGIIGQVHPNVAQDYDLPAHTLYLEMNLQPLMDHPRQTLLHQATHKYPSSSRDVAMLVDKSVRHGDIVKVIQDNGGKYLTQVHLFDLYQGDHIASDKQSLAYQLTFQNAAATITDEAIQEAMTQVIQALQAAFEVEIR